MRRRIYEDYSDMDKIYRSRCRPVLAFCNLSKRYVEDSKFREFIDSGKYVLVEDMIVLNSPECIEYKNGQLALAEPYRYAYKRVTLHYKHLLEYKRRVNRAVLVRPDGKRVNCKRQATYFGRGKIVEEVIEHASAIGSFSDVTIDNISAIIGGGDNGNNFTNELRRLMKENDITVEMLATLTGLDEKTIQRMRNPEKKTSKESVIAVCLALHLNPYLSQYLLNLAGFALTDSKEDKVYSFIIGFAFKETVAECNCMLRRLNMKPLSNL